MQIHGSPHRWFGDRDPEASLQSAIDDATSRVVGAVFPEQQDAADIGRRRDAQAMVEHGVPVAAYSDRYATYGVAPAAPG